MNNDYELLRRKYEREKAAREVAERLLEEKSLELYQNNQELIHLNTRLESLVTERSEELRETESQYEFLVENMHDLIFRLDLSGKILLTNRMAAIVLDSSRNDIRGKNIWDFLDQEICVKLKRDVHRQFLEKKCIETHEVYLKKRRSEESGWFRLSIHFSGTKCPKCNFRNDFRKTSQLTLRSHHDCVFMEIIVVAHDITEQKQIQFNLEQSHNELALSLRRQQIVSRISLIFNSPEDFEIKVSEALATVGNHTQVSRVYIFEDSADGMVTSNTYEWCNEGVSPQINDLQDIPYDMIPSWKKILDEEKMVFSTDISELPEDIYKILEPQDIKSIVVFPVNVSQKRIGFIGFDECKQNRIWTKSEIELLKTVSNIISNAYQRNKIQTELINREQENRILISSIPDTILQIDGEGFIREIKSSGKSPQFHLFNNRKPESIYELINEKLASAFRNGIAECLIHGEYNFDFQHHTLKQQEYYEARLIKINDKEILVIIRNITEIRENEHQLQKAKTLAEEASRAKSEFLANVSHEIRTPLNAILGFSRWLFENTGDIQHREYLSTILNSGKNLLALINDILDISKIESGKMDIELQPVNYQEIVTDIKLVFQEKIKQKGLAFILSTDPSVPEYIYTDELRFYQILFNLISNAIKFTSRGYIQVSANSVSAKNDDEINLYISIEDTGIGIPEDQQKIIFESFTQQSGQSSRDYEGTGLGLAIVNGLLHRLNGTISLKSKPGKGSLFTVAFNNLKKAKTAPPDPESLTSNFTYQLAPCKIMIVDDISFNIEVLKKQINSENAEYMDVHGGSEALARLKTEKPDLIFMDIRMPGMNGYEVAEEIRKDPHLRNIPMIAFTASVVKRVNDRIDELFDGFLQKPVIKKDLDTLLIRFLKHTIELKQTGPTEEIADLPEITPEMLEHLPELIKELETVHYENWQKIRDNLVIYEIEEFNNRLYETAFHFSCRMLTAYCKEMEMGLQSADIEIIGKKIREFPELIKTLHTYWNNH